MVDSIDKHASQSVMFRLVVLFVSLYARLLRGCTWARSQQCLTLSCVMHARRLTLSTEYTRQQKLKASAIISTSVRMGNDNSRVTRDIDFDFMIVAWQVKHACCATSACSTRKVCKT